MSSPVTVSNGVAETAHMLLQVLQMSARETWAAAGEGQSTEEVRTKITKRRSSVTGKASKIGEGGIGERGMRERKPVEISTTGPG